MFFICNLNKKTLLLSVVFIALLTSIPLASADEIEYKNPSGQWQVFTTPAKDFRILLPPNVKAGWDDEKLAKEDKRDGIERYQSSGVEHVFFFSLVPIGIESFEDIQKQVQTSLKSEGYSNFSPPKDLTGNNWRGIVFDMDSEGSEFTCLTGMDNKDTEMFMLITTLPFKDPRFAKIKDSIEIDSKLAKKKEETRIANSYKKLFSPKSATEFIGLSMLCLGIISVVIGGLWLWVEGFKVNFFWSLGMLLFPFVGLVFLCLHPGKAWRPFVIYITGFIAFIVGVFMAPK